MKSYEDKKIKNNNLDKIVNNSEYFDPEFYKRQFNICWDNVDPAKHYCEIGAENFYPASEHFDTCKYFQLNPDVYNFGLNPIFHYEMFGKFELRNICGVNEKLIYNICLKNCENSLNVTMIKHKRAAVFVSYNDKNIINDYIVFYLEYLKEVVDVIIFVSDNYYPPNEIAKISHLIDCYDCSRHEEYDFGSYKRGIEILKDNNLLGKFDELIICNDSAYGPLYSFTLLFDKMKKYECDFWGITNALQHQEHIQSYFYVFKKNVFESDIFINFFHNVKKEICQKDVILNYEVKLTKLLTDNNFIYKTLIDINNFDINKIFNFEEHPITAIENGSPFIKRKKIKNFWKNYEGTNALLQLIYNKNKSLYNIIKSESLINFDNLNEIKFSIILPTYNRGLMVCNAIESVLMQTFKNYELIVVDDNSDDDTENIINRRYKKFIDNNKIIYIKNDTNSGAAFSRNKGLELAKNNWICYLDSDNIIDPKFLEYFALAINNNDYNIFYCKMIRYPQNRELGSKYDRNKILNANYIDLGTFVHHKDLVKKYGFFDEKLSRLIDYEYILRLTENEQPFFIEIPLLKYNNGKYPRISNTRNFNNAFRYISDKYSNKIVISTIITSYNHENFIEKAIESALMQTGNFRHEIIISDDASIDNTLAIIKKYESQYQHKIINASNRINMGISENMKKSFGLATGKYVAILEGDDFWIDPFKLEKQMDFMEKNMDCKMCFSGSYILNNEDFSIITPERQKNLKQKIYIPTLIDISNPMITFSSTFYFTKILSLIPSYLYNERLSEYALAFFMCEFGNIGFLPDKSVMYRQRAGSAWTGLSKGEQLQSSINTLKNIINIDKKKFLPLLNKIINEKESELENLYDFEKKTKYFD